MIAFTSNWVDLALAAIFTLILVGGLAHNEISYQINKRRSWKYLCESIAEYNDSHKEAQS